MMCVRRGDLAPRRPSEGAPLVVFYGYGVQPDYARGQCRCRWHAMPEEPTANGLAVNPRSRTVRGRVCSLGQ